MNLLAAIFFTSVLLLFVAVPIDGAVPRMLQTDSDETPTPENINFPSESTTFTTKKVTFTTQTNLYGINKKLSKKEKRKLEESYVLVWNEVVYDPDATNTLAAVFVLKATVAFQERANLPPPPEASGIMPQQRNRGSIIFIVVDGRCNKCVSDGPPGNPSRQLPGSFAVGVRRTSNNFDRSLRQSLVSSGLKTFEVKLRYCSSHICNKGDITGTIDFEDANTVPFWSVPMHGCVLEYFDQCPNDPRHPIFPPWHSSSFRRRSLDVHEAAPHARGQAYGNGRFGENVEE